MRCSGRSIGFSLVRRRSLCHWAAAAASPASRSCVCSERPSKITRRCCARTTAHRPHLACLDVWRAPSVIPVATTCLRCSVLPSHYCTAHRRSFRRGLGSRTGCCCCGGESVFDGSRVATARGHYRPAYRMRADPTQSQRPGMPGPSVSQNFTRSFASCVTARSAVSSGANSAPAPAGAAVGERAPATPIVSRTPVAA
jgi:hypothetical protein